VEQHQAAYQTVAAVHRQDDTWVVLPAVAGHRVAVRPQYEAVHNQGDMAQPEVVRLAAA
jgi:hypothetical protein